MRRLSIFAGVIAASFGMAAPANAEPVCAGTATTVFVCVDPVGGTLFEDCVYTGGTSCEQVTVPGPTVDCGGTIYSMLVPPLTRPPC